MTTAHFTANTFKVLFYCLTYSSPATFLHLDRRWCTVFLCSTLNLHLSHSTNRLIFSHALISIISSRNASIDGFGKGQSYISTSQSLLHYLALIFHFEAPSLPNFVVYCFLVPHSRSSVFSSFRFNVTFFANSYTFSSNNTVVFTFLFTFSAFFFSDICFFRLSFLHATLIQSSVAAAM